MNDSATCAAELDIRNLPARLGRANDSRSIDEHLSAFAEEAVLQLPRMRAREGLDALRADIAASRHAGAVGPTSGVIYLLSATEVTLDGDRATACTPFMVFRDAASSPMPARAGRHDDRFQRRAAGWRPAREVSANTA